MLVEYGEPIEEETDERHVKMVSYDGKYPHLCGGTCILEIDGKQYSFGTKSEGADYSRFWSPTCEVWFEDEWTTLHVNGGEWEIDLASIPVEFRKYAKEFDEVFNGCVEHGGCGGCS